MDAQGERGQLAEALDRFSRVADKLNQQGGPANWNIVQVTGMGSFWNGMAVGVAVGVAVACSSWVAFTLGSLQDDQRQDDAFIQAAYQYAPGMREYFDRIRQEQSIEQRPDHHPTAPASSSGPAGSGDSPDQSASSASDD